MRLLFCLLLPLLPVLCQTAAPQPPTPPPAAEPKVAVKGDSSAELGPVAIRRFSFGGTYSYLPIDLLYAESYNQMLTATDGYVSANSTSSSHKAGGGVTMQFALSEHFAVNVNALYRSVKYSANYQYLLGFDKPTTAADERYQTSVTETASARYWDVPVLLRYYASGRHSSRGHYFIEGGPSLRLVRASRLSRDTISPDGDVSTVDTDYQFRRRNVPGFTVGLGRQFIDPFGIRIVPEMRFTQWMGPTFNTAPVRSTRSQVEFLISITF